MVGVFVVLDAKNNRLVATPHVESKGFITANKRALQKKASEIIGIEINRLLSSTQKVTYSDIKNTIRNVTSHFLYRESHRNPMVIPVILDYTGEELQ